MFIEWDESLSVGHSNIDNDHKHLIQMINRLYDAIEQRHGEDIIAEVLAELADYTSEHFTREEHVMIHFRYPELAEHRRQHDDLVNQLTKLIHSFELGQITVTLDTMEFLKHWLIDHVQSTDKKLAGFLRDCKGNSWVGAAKGERI